MKLPPIILTFFLEGPCLFFLYYVRLSPPSSLGNLFAAPKVFLTGMLTDLFLLTTCLFSIHLNAPRILKLAPREIAASLCLFSSSLRNVIISLSYLFCSSPPYFPTFPVQHETLAFPGFVLDLRGLHSFHKTY